MHWCRNSLKLHSNFLFLAWQHAVLQLYFKASFFAKIIDLYRGDWKITQKSFHGVWDTLVGDWVVSEQKGFDQSKGNCVSFQSHLKGLWWHSELKTIEPKKKKWGKCHFFLNLWEWSSIWILKAAQLCIWPLDKMLFRFLLTHLFQVNSNPSKKFPRFSHFTL